LNSITCPCIAALVRWNHWGSDWTPSSSTRTVEERGAYDAII
jgi:hypothetical protein